MWKIALPKPHSKNYKEKCGKFPISNKLSVLYKLCLINLTCVLKKLGLDKFIDFMVTREEMGLEKPALIMFNLSLKNMKIRADEAAYFGDALDRDILGAFNVGIKPFWFIADRNSIGGDNFIKIRSYRNPELKKIFFGG